MSPPNYAVEGRIREACADAGVLETALDDFVMDFRASRFTSEAELPKWIEQCRTEKPHRFKIAGAENHDLYVAAFGPAPNYTKQAEVVSLLGPGRAAEIAADFGTTLGSTKGGKVPAYIKLNGVDSDATKSATNPWSNHPDNVDERGRYTAKALARQGQCVRGVGEVKAAQIAAAVGSKLGDVRPRQQRAA